MKLSEFIRDNSRALQALYPEREAREIVLRLCEDLLGVSRVEHILNPDTEIAPELLPPLKAAMHRLLEYEPLQYVLGYAEFSGFRFKLDSSVLIPRPETEELVRIALDRVFPGCRVLDLCTGSGCIAWSVYLKCPAALVTAVDICSDALSVARSQFEGAGPEFVAADVLKPLPLEAGYDLLLSNPPYVRESEKPFMRRNVLDYEPELALFVKDDDPLVFYRAIASRSLELLKPGGTGLVEINESLSDETAAVFESAGLSVCGIIQDFAGKPRILSFQKPCSTASEA